MLVLNKLNRWLVSFPSNCYQLIIYAICTCKYVSVFGGWVFVFVCIWKICHITNSLIPKSSTLCCKVQTLYLAFAFAFRFSEAASICFVYTHTLFGKLMILSPLHLPVRAYRHYENEHKIEYRVLNWSEIVLRR